jgi:hypothetical protein
MSGMFGSIAMGGKKVKGKGKGTSLAFPGQGYMMMWFPGGMMGMFPGGQKTASGSTGDEETKKEELSQGHQVHVQGWGWTEKEEVQEVLQLTLFLAARSTA